MVNCAREIKCANISELTGMCIYTVESFEITHATHQ